MLIPFRLSLGRSLGLCLLSIGRLVLYKCTALEKVAAIFDVVCLTMLMDSSCFASIPFVVADQAFPKSNLQQQISHVPCCKIECDVLKVIDILLELSFSASLNNLHPWVSASVSGTPHTSILIDCRLDLV